MKHLSLYLLITGLMSCMATKKTVIATNPLEGTWIPVKQEMAGKELPPTAFANQKLILKDSTYTLLAESMDQGIIKYNNYRMDIYGKKGVNAGNHFTAIYKLEGEQLSICYNLGGEDYPVTYETTGHPVFFLSVFKRAVN